MAECPGCGGPVEEFELLGTTVAPWCSTCMEAEAAAEEQAARDEAVRRLLDGVREPVRSWTLETFGDQARSEDAGAAIAWSARVLAREPGDLFLFGPIGSGKTGLAWSIARDLAEEHAVDAAFANWREMLEQLRESFDDPDNRPNLNHLRRVRLLVLDDLGAERPTEWALEQLAGLIDHRNSRLSTIYTSNFAPGQLMRRFAADDKIVGDRIVSRLMQGTLVIHLDGPDRRAW